MSNEEIKRMVLAGDVDKAAFGMLEVIVQFLQKNKPNDHSEKDRRYAIAITDAEKLLAFVEKYIANG